MQTVDGTQLNIDALYRICPSCFTETQGDDSKQTDKEKTPKTTMPKGFFDFLSGGKKYAGHDEGEEEKAD